MSDEVPIRFESTDASTHSLKDLCAFITKGTTPTTYGFDWVEEGIPFLRSECVSDAGFSASGLAYISREAHENFGRSKVSAGDILVSITGNVGRIAVFPDELGEGNINQHIARIRIERADLVDPGYLKHVLSTRSYRRYYERIITGLAYPQISLKQVRETLVSLPPLPEQQKIAEILASVDDAIQATEAVIEQTKKVKQGMMNRLLTKGIGHTRFKQTEIGEIPEGWEVVPAESVCEAVIDCKNRTPPSTDRGFAVVRTPNVRNGRFIKKNLTFTDETSFVEWTRRGKPRSGDVLITREAPVGEVCAAPTEFEFCLGQRMMLYRPDRARLDQEFLLYSLQSTTVRRVLLERAGGSTVGHVRVGDIRALPIPIAPLEEQRQIVSILQSIDRQVTVLEGEHLALQVLKSSLMSDLLTGRTRVRINHGERS